MYPPSMPRRRPEDANEQRIDPFIRGAMAGAIAAIIGFVLCVAYLLLS